MENSKVTNANKIFINGFSAKLDKVDYQSLPDPNENDDIRVNSSSSYKIGLVDKDIDKLVIFINREIKFTKNILFQIDIIAKIEISLDKETYNHLKSNSEIEEYANSSLVMNKILLQTGIEDYISLLVAQITSTFGRQPLITSMTSSQ